MNKTEKALIKKVLMNHSHLAFANEEASCHWIGNSTVDSIVDEIEEAIDKDAMVNGYHDM
jgi:hypothetical protein